MVPEEFNLFVESGIRMGIKEKLLPKVARLVRDVFFWLIDSLRCFCYLLLLFDSFPLWTLPVDLELLSPPKENSFVSWEQVHCVFRWVGLLAY